MLGRMTLVVCALATPVAAERRINSLPDDVALYPRARPEPRIKPVRPLSLSVAIVAHESKLSGLAEDGTGPQLELAVGSGSWQGFVEGSISRVGLGPKQDFDRGARWRGGIGVRWIARSFELGKHVAAELVLEGVTGMQRFEWDMGGDMSRGDAGVGIGWQSRFFVREHQFGMRFVARVMYAPTSRDRAVALCTGSCVMPEESTHTGLTGIMGLVW